MELTSSWLHAYQYDKAIIQYSTTDRKGKLRTIWSHLFIVCTFRVRQFKCTWEAALMLGLELVIFERRFAICVSLFPLLFDYRPFPFLIYIGNPGWTELALICLNLSIPVSASLVLSSASSISCWALRNLARLMAAISSASSICFL